MNKEEIKIKRPGQILDYVDTREHLVDLFNHIKNLQQENKQLKERVDYLERSNNRREDEIISLRQELIDGEDKMKQYPIDRDLFCKIFKKAYLEYGKSWREEVITDSFMFRYHDDEFWLLHKPSGTLINWYKHLGRCLEVNKDLTIDEYKYLADLWYRELKEFNDD